jgi:hypothetical protein
MKNAEATATDTAATVAEQGATVAPEKAPSKKGASQKKGAPKPTPLVSLEGAAWSGSCDCTARERTVALHFTLNQHNL